VRGSLFKGVVLGSVCSALVFVASSALAGSGIGGVFNLGVSNSVNAQSTLTGASAAAQLQVTNAAAGASGLGVSSATSTATGFFNNTGGGTGLFAQTAGAGKPAVYAKNTGGGPAASFVVNPGVTPFTVGSTTKVTNLNADKVDGFDVNQIMSGGGRVTGASAENFFRSASTDTQVTVSLTAPNSGFVLVQGTTVFTDDGSFPLCSACYGVVRLHDVSANVDSPAATGSIVGNGTYPQDATIPVQWVFPVTAGNHQYTLTTWKNASGGPANFFNPVLTAEFIPFGHNGGSTLAVSGANTVAATPAQVNADGGSRGTP
jgi:hypothetical protein